LSFDPFQIDLPAREIISETRSNLQSNNTLIVTAPPGAGKSTLLPLALMEESWLSGQKIVMLEPRRLAAKSIAFRMSEIIGDEPGKTVGYRIRFENRTSDKTKIEVVTEGILTRMLQNDNALEGVGLVIFDEFHERSLHADLALALCREAQQILRPDLRIMIMSATLDMPQLASLLSCKTIESSGRQYPVEIKYGQDADETLLPELASRTIALAMRENEGDLLAFFPGEGEIRKCEEILRDQIPEFMIHPLYGQLSHSEQWQAVMPNKFGKRKIVLATSIAETSLTIEGIRIVVDTGFGRTSRFDPSNGLSKLETIRISKDSADQRAGRAGRLSSGACYRMWTKVTHDRLPNHRVPEIMEADLASLMLELANWGISDPNKLSWLTPPPRSSVSQASDTLHEIGALEKNRITTHGKQIHRLACHPRIAHMLLMAQDLPMKQLATDIASLLEERDPLPKESGADLGLRIDALRRNRSGSKGKFGRIEKAAASYRRMLNIDPSNEPFDAHDAGLLVAYAFPERIASARPGNNAQFQLSNGKYAAIGHKDDLAHEPWIAVANMDLRSGLGKIFLAAPLNPKDLVHLVKEQEQIVWDTRKGGVVATKSMRIGSIILQSKPIGNPSKEKITEAISMAIQKEGAALLNVSEEFVQLQNRISSLGIWNQEEKWPDVRLEYLLENNSEWLGPYLTDVRKPEDLKKIDLAEAFLHSLTFDLQQRLPRLAPSKIIVPSGSNIRIQYFPNGNPPVLAVRLQEMFGLADTPAINNGKIKVILHLLSPGYKPVQVTSDLKSFWDNLYFEVKKELQRRYPKHSWPDDPWKANPVAKGRSTKK
jgi:ATP-dependent helicase HrpB